MAAVQSKKRAVAWVKADPAGIEFAEIDLAPSRLAAVGVAIGSQPVPYRLDYRLETRAGYITSRLVCRCRGDGWSRRLELRREHRGGWRLQADATGAAPFPAPGGSSELLAGAVDCDLGLSPLTNSLPVLRRQMLTVGGSIELVAGWVSVPDLRVLPDQQRYTVKRVGDREAIIRFEAVDGSFAADITFDHDGLVLDYPGIARRLANETNQRAR
jgi:uncharacterized protein